MHSDRRRQPCTTAAPMQARDYGENPLPYVRKRTELSGAQQYHAQVRSGILPNTFDALRDESGYTDYLGALQRYRLGAMNDPRLLQMSEFLVSGFRNRLGIAIALRTYKAYRDLLASKRWPQAGRVRHTAATPALGQHRQQGSRGRGHLLGRSARRSG